MIKSTIKNFGKNILYAFIPMGILYLFILIAAFAFVEASVSNISGTLKELSALINASAEESSASVESYLSYAFSQIDWSKDLFGAIKQILDTNWIVNTLKGFFETLNASTEGFEENFTAIVKQFKDKLLLDVGLAVGICALGLILANYATRFTVRRKYAKRNFKKFIIAHTLVPLLQAATIAACLVLFYFIRYYSLIVLFVCGAATGALSIISAYLIHRDGSVKLKEIPIGKGVLQYLAITGIAVAFLVVFAVVTVLINPILGILLTLPLILYTFAVVDGSVEAYVAELVTAPPANG